MLPTGTKTPFELQTIIANALRNDADLADFCITEFNKAASVFNGFDLKAPPERSFLPMIAVALATVQIENSFNVPEYSFFIGGSVEVSEACTDIDGVQTYSAVDKAYKFGALVMAVVSNAVLADSNELGYDLLSLSALDFTTDFPFVNFNFTATIVVNKE